MGEQPELMLPPQDERDGHPGFDAHMSAGRMHDSGSWSDVQIEGEKVTVIKYKSTLFFFLEGIRQWI